MNSNDISDPNIHLSVLGKDEYKDKANKQKEAIDNVNTNNTIEQKPTIESKVVDTFRTQFKNEGYATLDELDPEDLIELDEVLEEVTDQELQFDIIDEHLNSYPNDLTRISNYNQLPNSLISSIGVKKDGANHENQDYIYSDNSITICCDGIGSGKLSGEIAKEFAESLADVKHGLINLNNLEQAKSVVNQTLSIINQRLKQKQINQPQKYEAAGSTLAAVVKLIDGKRLVFTLGDSEVLKLNYQGEVQTVTNPQNDTLFHFVLKQMGIQEVESFMDISYQDFILKLKDIYPNYAHLESSEFIEHLANSLNIRALNFAKQYLESESAYKKGKQAVIKGVLQTVEISEGNLKIIDQNQDEFLMAVTDGLTDQMSYSQIGQVFLFGGIKSLIQKYSKSHPEILELALVQKIIEKKYIVDIDFDIDLSKTLNSIIKIINPKKLFRKPDSLKAIEIKELVMQGGSSELHKESIANMLGERVGILGYKTPKKDNISIAVI